VTIAGCSADDTREDDATRPKKKEEHGVVSWWPGSSEGSRQHVDWVRLSSLPVQGTAGLPSFSLLRVLCELSSWWVVQKGFGQASRSCRPSLSLGDLSFRPRAINTIIRTPDVSREEWETGWRV